MNYNKSEDELNFFNAAMYEFSYIYDNLFLFFHIRENGRCFFTTFYYEPLLKRFSDEFDFSKLMNIFWSDKEIALNILQYYFPSVEEKDHEFYCRSNLHTAQLIDESDYDDRVKSKLFSFFANPRPVIEKLHDSLISMDLLLSKYYERHIQTVTNVQNKIEINNLAEDLKKINNNSHSFDSFDDIYISICLLSKNCIYAFLYDNSTILLLGYDYKDHISFLKSQREPVELDEIANVLSEKNRLDILDIILRKGEASIKDFENELRLSATNAYYHITMMFKANMIRSRNEGKTVLYSLNKNHFNAIIDHLKKYI